MSTLVVGLLAGALGMGYIVYGKWQARFVPLVAGILLCVYPYFTDSAGWQIGIGLALAAAPFVLREG